MRSAVFKGDAQQMRKKKQSQRKNERRHAHGGSISWDWMQDDPTVEVLKCLENPAGISMTDDTGKHKAKPGFNPYDKQR